MTKLKATKNLESVESVLLDRKRVLEEEFAHLNDDKGDDTTQDPGDQANSAAFETLKSSLQNNEYEEYKMIVKALEMIKDGTYGICCDCHEPISPKRLASYPNAARCLVCQETLEESTASEENNSFV